MRSLLSPCRRDALSAACAGRCVYRCVYCGLHDLRVECGGIYYCPQPLCSGPGGAWFRLPLPSCEHDRDRHSVDALEWRQHALAYVIRHPEVGAEIAARVAAEVAEWVSRNPSAQEIAP